MRSSYQRAGSAIELARRPGNCRLAIPAATAALSGVDPLHLRASIGLESGAGRGAWPFTVGSRNINAAVAKILRHGWIILVRLW
jgi:hypothetical protein